VRGGDGIGYTKEEKGKGHEERDGGKATQKGRLCITLTVEGLLVVG